MSDSISFYHSDLWFIGIKDLSMLYHIIMEISGYVAKAYNHVSYLEGKLALPVSWRAVTGRHDKL